MKKRLLFGAAALGLWAAYEWHTILIRHERINRAAPQRQEEIVPARHTYPYDKLSRT